MRRPLVRHRGGGVSPAVALWVVAATGFLLGVAVGNGRMQIPWPTSPETAGAPWVGVGLMASLWPLATGLFALAGRLLGGRWAYDRLLSVFGLAHLAELPVPLLALVWPQVWPLAALPAFGAATVWRYTAFRRITGLPVGKSILAYLLPYLLAGALLLGVLRTGGWVWILTLAPLR